MMWLRLLVLLLPMLLVARSSMSSDVLARHVAEQQSINHAQQQTETFDTWRDGFQRRVGAAGGLSSANVATVLDALTADRSVLALSQRQPEHTLTVGTYVTRLVSDERIAMGRPLLDLHKRLLAELERTYGVPPNVLLAIWGLESRYGLAPGTRSVVRSLATLAAFDQRRGTFWEQQLSAALEIVAAGDRKPNEMTGSWAGAMGHVQFIPTTYVDFAVDHDRDGRRDIWSSKADALASAANYLKRSGWQRGLAWGWEVGLPDGFDFAASGLAVRKSLEAWSALGVKPVLQTAVTAVPGQTYSLLVPQGHRGPAFLVSQNFRVIMRYNAAVPYALAIGHMSDRLLGGPEISTIWPDVIALDRAQRMVVQRLLGARGYDTGGIDGILGTKSVHAIRDVQRTWRVPQDGFADAEFLKRLQNEQTATLTGELK